METGFYQMTNENYHKEEAVSKSGLELFHRSPAHYQAKELLEPTPAMIFGATYHTAILQPDLIEQDYIIAPEGLDGRTKDGKVWKLEAQATGKSIIPYDDWQTIKAMKKVLQNHSTAWALLSAEGPREISGFWIDKNTGLECKLRADLISSENHIVVDLKTTIDARSEPFIKQIANLHYHWQGYWYLAGVTEITGEEHKNFVIVAQEKDPPYAVVVYRLDDAMIYMGQEEIKILLDEFRACKEADKWPAYLPDEIQPISLPDWYFKQSNVLL